MNYAYKQLTRVSPKKYRRYVWWARGSRLWKRYLRLAAAVAGLLGKVVLTLQYFILLPLFAVFAKRAERKEGNGWIAIRSEHRPPTSQY